MWWMAGRRLAWRSLYRLVLFQSSFAGTAGKQSRCLDANKRSWRSYYSQLPTHGDRTDFGLKGKNLPLLLEIISKYLWRATVYPEVVTSARALRRGELIREQVLHLTWDEVPHSVAVLIEEMADRQETAPFYIRATVLVERESQKGIIIGQGGRQLKAIGQRARKGIEELLGRQVYLDLWVKVKEEWRDREESLHELGYFDR